jgi:hypothetical protein
MTADVHRSEYLRLQELTHRNLLRLIDSELSLALTMSELAETESQLGDEAHAQVLLGKVAQAVESVRHHVSDDRISEGEEREVEDRLRGLNERLEIVRQRIA